MVAELDLLAAAMQEPRWLTITGLSFDIVGGVLVAAVAWVRVSVRLVYGGPGVEPDSPLRWRRAFILLGGALLSVGFGLQIWATVLQMARG